ncbi:hypothetical protein [Hyphomicrobium sp.]|jgi:hypothetical protein|uniref:hypothetical protein n=1 Tax=Hyphomicrobium sp. TaxID=82 RepID=UPI002CF6175A|nr:hypothetical protein [Hyphomicrobium sp.]HVZ06062.1 hypothetical protein [Hyphomicrobium sp.]
MCDYSLEMYRSRPAQEGEEYISNKFPTGSVGFVAPGDQSVAICMDCDTELKLANIPAHLREQAGLGETEFATFTQMDGPYHRDSIRFRNGKVLTLQQLGPGVTASLVETVKPVPFKPVDVREFV